MVEKWLERLFLNMDGYNFIDQYKTSVIKMLEKEVSVINTSGLSDNDKAIRIKMIDENRRYFDTIG